MKFCGFTHLIHVSIPLTNMKTHESVALSFGHCIVAQDWEAAQKMLSLELVKSISPADIQNKVSEMIAYTQERVTAAAVITEMEDWPEREKDDLGWVYVALSGDTFSEAVTVVVKSEGGNPAIRSLEWGRP